MLDPVAQRYADALFSLAKKSGVLEEVRRDVARLAEEVSQPGAGAYLFDARVSVGERRKRLDPILSGLHQMTRNFVGLVFDKRRESLLSHLGEAFHRRVLEERGAAEGLVRSARPLGAAEVRRLASSIGSKLGKTLTLDNQVDPDLLAGVRVIVGSRMIDHSLSGRLNGLKKRMLDAPLPSLAEG